MRSLLIFLLLAALPGGRAAEAPRGWETWDGCRLVAERFYDGDSFQVKRGSAIFILRLYSADALETDDGYGARIGEQAAYFGITNAEVLRGGGLAKEFTARFLATPFRVHTRRKSAPGASRGERFYAIVERDGQRLDAALIEAGLARATGETADFPDADAGHTTLLRLRALEQKAGFERRGLWATSQRQDRRQTLSEKLKPVLRPGTPLATRKVNLNTAPPADLEGLPGIGPKTAEAIIRARPLRDFAGLDTVPGIGPKKIEALRDLVTFQ